MLVVRQLLKIQNVFRSSENKIETKAKRTHYCRSRRRNFVGRVSENGI